MPQFRQKSIVVEARLFDSTDFGEQSRLAEWCGGRLRGIKLMPEERVIQIDTREGEMEAMFGDWIIRGVKGEFYPCKQDIFDASYELVEGS